MDAAAPARDTLMDAAMDALRMHSCNSIPSDNVVRKYPVKVSPAAVVSTADEG